MTNKMTQEVLDALIKEIIIPQSKPRNTGNSFFRKREERRRLKRFIPASRLKNIAKDFYDGFTYLRFAGLLWWGNNYKYMYIWSNNGALIGARYCGSMDGVRYSGVTGRLKKLADCEPRKDVRNKRLIKKIKRRQPRKCADEIANGSAYKKIKMKNPVIG